MKALVLNIRGARYQKTLKHLHEEKKQIKSILFKFKLCRTFYSNNLHNIVGSVLSVTLMVLFGGI